MELRSKKLIMLKPCQLLFFLYSSLIVPSTYSSINNSFSIDTDKNNSVLSDSFERTEIFFPEIDYQNVIRLFMKSVARGELLLFNKVIYQGSIKPLRIEYLYNIEEKYQTVKVYSSLHDEIYHPDVPDIRIKGITAVLNHQGNIIEVIAHAGS